jgi:hypothetical protein
MWWYLASMKLLKGIVNVLPNSIIHNCCLCLINHTLYKKLDVAKPKIINKQTIKLLQNKRTNDNNKQIMKNKKSIRKY